MVVRVCWIRLWYYWCGWALGEMIFQRVSELFSAAQGDPPAQRSFLTDQINNIGSSHYLFYYKPSFSNQRWCWISSLKFSVTNPNIESSFWGVLHCRKCAGYNGANVLLEQLAAPIESFPFVYTLFSVKIASQVSFYQKAI